MSNFICPTCGFKNIDCGKDGYKTGREIELEKENLNLYLQRNSLKSQLVKRNNEKKRLKDENKHLSDLLANQDKEVERLRNLLEVVKDRFMAYTANIPLNAEDLDLVGEINAAIGENVTENITNKNRNIIPSNESDEL